MINMCSSFVPAATASSCRGWGFRSRTNDNRGGRSRLVATTSAIVPRRSPAGQIARPQVVSKPRLMLSSTETPEGRFLYDALVVDEDREVKENEEKEIKIRLPSLAAAPDAGGDLRRRRRRRRRYHRRYHHHHCIGSSEGFIIFFDEDTEEIAAVNPVTDQQLPVPSIATLIEPDWELHQDISWGKAILSPSRDAMVIITQEDQFFSPVGGSRWTFLPEACTHPLCDCIFHKGLFYCIDIIGNIAVYDLEHPITPPFFFTHPDPDGFYEEPTRYLVESPDGTDLFGVYKGFPELDFSPDDTCIFRVFKLAKDDVRWDEVEDIGDLALFLGSNCSLALKASDDPSGSIKSNCIYFTNDYYQRGGYSTGDVKMNEFLGVFDLRERSPQYYKFDDRIKRKLDFPLPLWFMPSSS